MHYFIDGYNLMFRLIRESKEDLQKSREKIIISLNEKASLLNLNISLIFDAAYQVHERACVHYDALEIIFSSTGETADDLILYEIEHSVAPHQEIVVTSDKQLARKVKSLSAKAETVETFISSLNRLYYNKLHKKQKKQPVIIPQIKSPPTTCASSPSVPLSYQEIFEARYADLVKDKPEKPTPKLRPPEAHRFTNENQIRSHQSQSNIIEYWIESFEGRFRKLMDEEPD